VAIKDESNVTFTLLPSLAPAPDLQRLAGAGLNEFISPTKRWRWPTQFLSFHFYCFFYFEISVCGKPVYRWPKIVSGENARLGQWPWQVKRIKYFFRSNK
jgi:hypothetical protein